MFWLPRILKKHSFVSISPDYSHIRRNKIANWNLENGYTANAPTDSQTYPYRVAGSGADGHRLRAWLELSTVNLENLCRGPTQGYKVVLHLPGEIPQVSKYYSLIPLLQEVSVSVKANIMKTSEGLRYYHHKRCVTFIWATVHTFHFCVISDANVISIRNGIYASWKCTLSEIVNWNVYQMLLWVHVDVWNFLNYETQLHRYVDPKTLGVTITYEINCWKITLRRPA